jgi:hypothetical protein
LIAASLKSGVSAPLAVQTPDIKHAADAALDCRSERRDTMALSLAILRIPTKPPGCDGKMPPGARLAGRWISVTGCGVRSRLLVLLSSGPAHALAGQFDAVGVVNEANQDRVGVGRGAEAFMMPSFLIGCCVEDGWAMSHKL